MKGVVYLLTSIETGKGYVGSTINLKDRLWKHRNEKRNNCRSKLLGRFTHLILEEYIDDDITDKKEFKLKLELVERKWQDFYKGYLVNRKRSQVTRKERIEKHKELSAKYRAEKPEKIKESWAKYKAENPEKIKEYKKRYRAEHIDEINAKLKEKFNCECGGKYTYINKSQHIKTKMHQEYIVIK